MATKTATKKTATAAKATTKDQFQAKKVGVTMIVTFNKEKYSRKVTKEESDILMKKMALYNKKPTDANKKVIVKLLTPTAVKKIKEIEATEAKIKGYKNLQKKEDKKAKISKSDKRDIMEELEELLNTDKESIVKTEAILAKFRKIEIPERQNSPSPRGGEY